MTFLKGYRTYLVAILALIIIGLERLCGIDVPGISTDGQWLAEVLSALGLAGLRASQTGSFGAGTKFDAN